MGELPPSLRKRPLFAADGVIVSDVRCSSCRSSWSQPEEASQHALVLVRRGCFRLRTAGRELLADAACVYFERSGEAYEVAHPHEGGDACTQIVVDEELLGAIAGDAGLPSRATFSSPQVDLQHRLLLAHAERGDDALELAERAVGLVASILGHADTSGRPARRAAAVRTRRRAVDDVREALAVSPAAGLPELARSAAVSPHHLSRIFRAETGETISRYRNRVRVRVALERLADGEERLTRLAAELGFADHAHLTRVVRAETGWTPSVLRAALGRAPEPAAAS
jgi:AraC-like DNA-binding protein